MFKSVLIVLGLVSLFATSGCVFVGSPRHGRAVVVARPHYHETVVVRRSYCR